MTRPARNAGSFAVEVLNAGKFFGVDIAEHREHITRNLFLWLVVLGPLIDDVTMTAHGAKGMGPRIHDAGDLTCLQVFEHLQVLEYFGGGFVFLSRNGLLHFRNLLIDDGIRPRHPGAIVLWTEPTSLFLRWPFLG